MKLIGYSERGIMNAIFYHIALTDDRQLLRDILDLGKFQGLDTADMSDVKMYLEGSLSQYGDPDLVIKITDSKGARHVIFVEAKVQTYGNLSKAWLKFQSDKKYNGHSSNLFFQLYLRKLFMNTTDEDLRNGVRDRLCDTKPRKIGSNSVVRDLAEDLREGCPTLYLCAIIPDEQSQWDNDQTRDTMNIDGTPVHFISWKQIVELCDPVRHKFILDNFDWNKEQIFSHDA